MIFQLMEPVEFDIFEKKFYKFAHVAESLK